MKRILVGLCLVLACTAPVAYAQNCDAIVADEAGLIKETSAIVAAAKELVDEGAEPRVRTFMTLRGQGTLDLLLKNILLRDCPSWANVQGTDLKGNMIFLAVSVEGERKGFYAGGDFRYLEPDVGRIREKVMRPKFGQGDFAGGFAAGLNEAAHLISMRFVGVPVPGTTAAAQAPMVVQQPTDFTGLWWVMGLGLLVLVIAGVVSAVRIRNHRRKQEEERRSVAQQSAGAAKVEASGLVNKISGLLSPLDAQVEVLAKKVDESDLSPIMLTFEKAKRDYEDANVERTDYVNTVTDPDTPGRSVLEYARIEKELKSVSKRLEMIHTSVKAVELSLNDLEKMVVSAPGKVAEIGAVLATALNRIDDVTKMGFRTDGLVSALKTTFEPLHEKAGQALRDRKYCMATDFANQAIAVAKGAAEKAEEIPKTQNALLRRIFALRDASEAASQKVEDARVVFTSITEGFAETCWTSIKGNGTEASNRTYLAAECVNLATKAVSMEVQDWAAASAALDKGEKAVERAVSITASITKLDQSLREAQSHAQRDVNTASVDLDKAERFNAQVDVDVDDKVWTLVDDGHAAIKKAHNELNQPKPDYFEVIKLAKAAHELADKALAQGRTESEAAERLRQKLAIALRDAESRVSNAQEYIDDHRSDVKKSVHLNLELAQKTLISAKNARHIQDRINQAEQSEQFSKTAYADAQANVAQAEKARRPRSRSSTVIVNAPNYGGPTVESTWGTKWTSGEPSPTPTPSIGGDSAGFSSPDPGPSIGSDSPGW